MLKSIMDAKTPHDIRLLFFIVYGSFGIIVFGIYSIINFVIADYIIAFFELFLTLFTAFIVFLSIKTKSHFFAETLGILPIFFITIHNFVNGGFDNTGVLWTYVLPPIVVFLSGIKRGIVIGLIYLLSTFLYFIGSFWLNYEFRYSNFGYAMYLVSFISVYAMTLLFQLAWDLSHKALHKEKIEIEKIKCSLEEKVDQLEIAKKDLEDSMNKLQSANNQIQKQVDIMIDRELDMAKLKDEIKE